MHPLPYYHFVPYLSESRAVLAAIIEYLEHHNGSLIDEDGHTSIIPLKPLVSREMADNCPRWDADFINRQSESKDHLTALVLGCNHLAVSPLLSLACAKIACNIKLQPFTRIMDLVSSNPNILEDVGIETKENGIDDNLPKSDLKRRKRNTTSRPRKEPQPPRNEPQPPRKQLARRQRPSQTINPTSSRTAPAPFMTGTPHPASRTGD
jgi:hypothetical protein